MKRRGNGEGSAPQLRKDGRWSTYVTVPAQGLEPTKRKAIYGKTERECASNRRRFWADQAAGGPLPGRAPTLKEFGKTFLDDYLVARVQLGMNRESTRRNYKDIWARHIAPDLGHLRLDEITPLLITQWSASKVTTRSAHRDKPLSPATQVRIFGVLRNAINVAYKHGLIRDNPMQRVDPPRGAKPTLVPLELPELVAVLKALEGTQLYTVAALMVLTGARPGEALAASWNDIALDAATWHISRSLARVSSSTGKGTVLGFSATKTRLSNATIALPQLAVEQLRRHHTAQAQTRLASVAWADPDLVFTTSLGTPLESRNLLRKVKEAARAAGVTKNVRLHDLRHAAASALLAEGVNMEVTSKLLRHSRLATTADIYSHLLESVRTESADVMDARYRGLLNG
jgi:integrase